MRLCRAHSAGFARTCSLHGVRSILLVATLIAFEPAWSQQHPAYKVREQATPCLVIRAEPKSGSQMRACLPPGTEATGIGEAPYWRKVRFSGNREGWAPKKYLEQITAPSTPSDPTAIPADAWLEVHFVDVGQGDGIYIRTHDDNMDGNGIFEGRNIVIDGGPDSLLG